MTRTPDPVPAVPHVGMSFWNLSQADVGDDAGYPRMLTQYVNAAVAHDRALIEAACIRADGTSSGVLVLYDETCRVVSAEPDATVPRDQIHERRAW